MNPGERTVPTMKTMAGLLPHEVAEARDVSGTVFVPLGPLEWHGPHLPFGTDPVHATHIALRAAAQVGGLVLPTLFAGSETVVPVTGREHDLHSMGLADTDQVIGMDFPGNSVNSLYFEESAFALAVRELIQGLRRNRFGLIVLVSGHGAVNHLAALARVAAEANYVGGTHVIVHGAWGTPSLERVGDGHASRAETSTMMALEPDQVRLDLLPPRGEPLHYRTFAIVDGPAFSGDPTSDFTVRPDYDPRLSTREEGEDTVAAEVANAAAHVEEIRRELAL